VNGLFGKLLNFASEEVILELVRTKCTSVLLYELRVFSVGQGTPALLRLSGEEANVRTWTGCDGEWEQLDEYCKVLMITVVDELTST